MVKFAKDVIDNGKSGVILAPRGSAKTTWITTILCSWLASVYPNIRIGLISNTAKQSNAFSRSIRWTLESNTFQHDIFGNLKGPVKWNDVEWIAKDSLLHGSKDVTMYSTGAGGAIISKRFDVILCDDILDEENTSNPDQREKVENWFWKTLKPCLVPGGSILVVGTRWAEGDLYQKLIEDKKWPYLRKQAFVYEPDDLDHDRPQSYWPEIWPIDKLQQEKLDMGAAMFACSYLNDISGLMEGNIFSRHWFRSFDSLPAGRRYEYKMGVDLASSEKQRADFTAIATVAQDDLGNTFVLDVVRSKMETGHRQFVVDAFLRDPTHPVSRVIVENNQFQSTLVAELLKTTTLPVVGKRSDVDKVTRARAVAARYESGKVYHHRSLAGGDFELELLQFPKGHDDMIDALGNAMETGSQGAFWGTMGYR